MLPDYTWVEESTRGRYKCKIQTVDIAEDCAIPRGAKHSVDGAGYVKKDWLETLTKENPQRGAGDAGQVIQKRPVHCTIIDLVASEARGTTVVVTDGTHLEQLLLQYP
jgi:hypothetical protein